MADNPRIEELRRRVEKNPASLAFAQLAEEHRRAGDYEEAIRVSRSGLAQHPRYLSARVTLGRALLEIGEYDEAQAELEQVLGAAPDNLAAIRALAEIHQRRDDAGHHETHVEPALPPPVPLPDGSPATDLDLAFRGSDEQFTQALDALGELPPELSLDAAPPQRDAEQTADDVQSQDPTLPELEDWLAAIIADRDRRAVKARSHS